MADLMADRWGSPKSQGSRLFESAKSVSTELRPLYELKTLGHTNMSMRSEEGIESASLIPASDKLGIGIAKETSHISCATRKIIHDVSEPT